MLPKDKAKLILQKERLEGDLLDCSKTGQALEFTLFEIKQQSDKEGLAFVLKTATQNIEIHKRQCHAIMAQYEEVMNILWLL